ncbi:acetyltransferase [Frondihabitans sp. PAMC 28766]|uniref:GNAT family N-acetyltransferase n=1 Tax=Frondihabitans sp. PAMC 28766 TaxID=1795630 RepID=UPI00078C45C8|nr:GNAT family N-acetyltransferase [Frondihabitans sp. PAMC 28766]AMM19893.1 acetyltransferase [Frondihabitans sp. PAMC 28766]
MDDVDIRPARADEIHAVAELRWRWLAENRRVPVVGHEEFVSFFVDFAARHPDHHCAVAVRGGVVVGMAWLAVVSRVPSPTQLERASGDVQSVYVVPDARGGGIGGRLMGAVLSRADQLELGHVTVHSSDGAVTLYQRAGFAASPTYLVRTPDGQG